MTIEAMTQALAVLEEIADEVFSPYDNKLGDAILALHAAIEQAERVSTHSEDCWKWHHPCAVAKIERGQTQKPPAWWPAVEKILNEYGLQAIDFVADFKAAMKDAEQPAQQEPVAWKWKERVNDEFDSWVVTASEPPPYAIETHPLYTAPRQWQGLTDEEFQAIAIKYALPTPTGLMYFKDEIEAKLKEKNHA